jgi:hypothetical protein
MSFDMWFQTVGDGHEYDFSSNIVRDVFRPYLKSDTSNGYDLSFPTGGNSILDLDENLMINGFGINRPSGEMLYDCLYALLLRVPGSYLFWPGGVAVSDPKRVSELPEPMIKSFAPIPVVRNGKDIVDAIHHYDKRWETASEYDGLETQRDPTLPIYFIINEDN